MITKLSPSSIRTYCTDRNRFYRQYVLYERPVTESSTVIVGKAVHKYIELIGKDDLHLTIRGVIALVSDGKEIIYNKGETPDKVEKMVTCATDAWLSTPNNPGFLIGIEESIAASPYVYDRMPLVPLKCIVDAVYQRDTGDIYVVDYKTVKKFTSTPTPAHKIQAWINMLLVEQKYKKRPLYMEFLELKVMKSKDKNAPLYNSLYVQYPDELEVALLYELIDRIYSECQGEHLLKEGRAVPNIYDQMTGKAAWDDLYAYVLKTL